MNRMLSVNHKSKLDKKYQRECEMLSAFVVLSEIRSLGRN